MTFDIFAAFSKIHSSETTKIDEHRQPIYINGMEKCLFALNQSLITIFNRIYFDTMQFWYIFFLCEIDSIRHNNVHMTERISWYINFKTNSYLTIQGCINDIDITTNIIMQFLFSFFFNQEMVGISNSGSFGTCNWN